MKVGSKRRRTKQTIEDERVAAEAKAQAIEEKLATIDRVLQENARLKAQPEPSSVTERVLEQMLEQGFVQRDD